MLNEEPLNVLNEEPRHDLNEEPLNVLNERLTASEKNGLCACLKR